VRGRISNPVPGSFMHLDGMGNGAGGGGSGGGGGSAPVSAVGGGIGGGENWPGEADSWDQERTSGKFI